jgi:hypothetical protein
MDFGFTQYWKPTPVNIRKFADAILAASALIGTNTIVTSNPKLGAAIMVVGVIAKIISNFFSETPTTNETP